MLCSFSSLSAISRYAHTHLLYSPPHSAVAALFILLYSLCATSSSTFASPLFIVLLYALYLHQSALFNHPLSAFHIHPLQTHMHRYMLSRSYQQCYMPLSHALFFPTFSFPYLTLSSISAFCSAIT
jgi:hypothetical protein